MGFINVKTVLGFVSIMVVNTGCEQLEQAVEEELERIEEKSIGSSGSARYFYPPFSCFTTIGELVNFIYSEHSGNWYAYRDSFGNPYISWDPYIGPRLGLSELGDLFFYAHECAHHALGHTTYGQHPLIREKEADCFAISWLTTNGYISDFELTQLMNELSGIPGDGWVYLPGPQRAISVGSCANF